MTNNKLMIYPVDYEPDDYTEEFEQEFTEFELNRMYPPNYRKESIMNHPTIKHADSVRNCILLLECRVESAIEPRVKKSLQQDIDTMQELHKILLYIIDNPTLPFCGFPVNLEKLNDFQPSFSDDECDGI